MNKQQRERMATLACDLVKLPLGGAVLYPLFQESPQWGLAVFGFAIALFLIHIALVLESDYV